MVVDRRAYYKERNKRIYQATLRGRFYPIVDELVEFMKSDPTKEMIIDFLMEHNVRVKA